MNKRSLVSKRASLGVQSCGEPWGPSSLAQTPSTAAPRGDPRGPRPSPTSVPRLPTLSPALRPSNCQGPYRSASTTPQTPVSRPAFTAPPELRVVRFASHLTRSAAGPSLPLRSRLAGRFSAASCSAPAARPYQLSLVLKSDQSRSSAAANPSAGCRERRGRCVLKSNYPDESPSPPTSAAS